MIAVGTKSGVIKIFCAKTGAKLQELVEHAGGVCCLTLIKDTSSLLSGGDVGCCRVIGWEINQLNNQNSMSIFSRKHLAAVTSILDLQDNKHVMSGSFDSQVHVYNTKSK